MTDIMWMRGGRGGGGGGGSGPNSNNILGLIQTEQDKEGLHRNMDTLYNCTMLRKM